MGWTETARREHDRRRLRYTSDCTDAEWAIIAPLLTRTSKVGRPRLHRARDVWNAIQYLAATGCQWAQLPRDFPPSTSVHYHFYRMRDSGLLDAVNAVLVAGVRVAEGRRCRTDRGHHRQPVGQDYRSGRRARLRRGQEIKGRKRHIATDTAGSLLDALILPAGVQDRDAAPGLLERCRDAYPSLVRFVADGGYAGPKLENAIAHIDRLAIEIVKRSDTRSFVILPRRWVVERTIAWLNRCRRLAKDWEASIASSEAWLVIASIRRMTRRIAKLEL
ncbi:IS5 family transposase [Sphingomonas sp. Leaf4]|uniref:IS5 family transposase n=1 Tax=Sphingomonas sp. Leaf4 TaxID=2876553 RepID=UPI001E629787|nr:IS5 family transposase [Sphingomonas sp. Leaf4]